MLTTFKEQAALSTVLAELKKKGIVFVAGETATTAKEVGEVFTRAKWPFDPAELAAYELKMYPVPAEDRLNAAHERINELELVISSHVKTIAEHEATIAEHKTTIEDLTAQIEALKTTAAPEAAKADDKVK